MEKSLEFTVGSRATYTRTAGGWHLVVSIPTAGTVSAKQPLATSSKVKPKPLVQAKREALNSRGKVTLLLKATPQGQAVLNAQHVLRVNVTVTVDSRDGREAHKTVSLSLRR
jgi:outer membrane lipopolysaccharide assembly protein LptE/RlpB